MRSFIASFVFCISVSLSAYVAHIDTMKTFVDRVYQLAEHLNPADVLIIFDIDNTLVRPRGPVGSDEWVEHLLRKKMNEGFALQEALDVILPLYCHVQYHIKMQSVEAETAALIRALQQKGFFTLCLTARSHFIAEQTLKQLVENGFSFQRRSIAPFSFNVSSPVIYKDGVIFVSSQCKGAMAVKFIEKFEYKPKMVIFIDDKLRHVEKMACAMEALGIEFHGFRYSYCDKHIDAFDPEYAERELADMFHKGISALIGTEPC